MKKSRILIIYESDQIQQFLSQANHFCDLIESEKDDEPIKFLNEIQKVLLKLYVHANELPEIELEENENFQNDLSQQSIKKINISDRIGKYGIYWEMHDPIFPKDKKPVCGSLMDDLGDIYGDIKRNLLILNLKNDNALEEALWDLKFSFETHWGHHLIDTLRALHYLKFDHMGKA